MFAEVHAQQLSTVFSQKGCLIQKQSSAIVLSRYDKMHLDGCNSNNRPLIGPEGIKQKQCNFEELG